MCKKWERSLTTIKQRPTPKLFQWLRQENPAHSGALVGPNGPLLTTQEIFAEHRRYWEGICTHPDPIAKRASVQSIHRKHLQADPAPLDFRHLLEAAKNLKMDTRTGADGWTSRAAKALHPEAGQPLSGIFRYIEQHITWPPSLLRVKMVLIPKPDTSGTSPSDWRPIAVSPPSPLPSPRVPWGALPFRRS